MLRLLGILLPARKTPVDPGGARKILVVDFSFIGDLVMTSVVHRGLREKIPGAKIHVLGFPVVKHLLPLIGAIDVLHPVPQAGAWKQVLAALKLRRERFDVAIHLNTGLWVNFLVRLTGAPLRVGYDYRGRGCFHNVRIPIGARTVRTKFRPEECVELLERAFGWRVTERVARLEVDRATDDVVAEKLKRWGVAETDLLIGIHTSSRQDRETRCWDEGKFAELANLLIDRHDAKLIFTDVAADREYVEPILKKIGRKDRIVDAMGQTTIPELCALLKRIDLYISINTAPMHFAIAIGTPMVAIIGYGPPHIYFPPGDPRFAWVTDPALEWYDPQDLVQKAPSRIREIGVGEVSGKVDSLLQNVVNRTSTNPGNPGS